MTLWQWTFLALLITASFGIVLFTGYTFRVRIRYPFALVTSHVVSAFITVILFSILFVQKLRFGFPAHSYSPFVLWPALVLLLATFASGVHFYFKYNARRLGLRNALLIAHLFMAALSFVAVIASTAELSVPPKPTNLYPGSMYNFYKHQH